MWHKYVNLLWHIPRFHSHYVSFHFKFFEIILAVLLYPNKIFFHKAVEKVPTFSTAVKVWFSLKSIIFFGIKLKIAFSHSFVARSEATLNAISKFTPLSQQLTLHATCCWNRIFVARFCTFTSNKARYNLKFDNKQST